MKQGAGSREQGAGSREQGAGSKGVVHSALVSSWGIGLEWSGG